ncbi:MAG: hypothetical protein RL318_592 [Fibrobacterota bacterium]|jgi:small subunit ribosomal protein S2
MSIALPSLQAMLEAGVHFGHQTRRWDPRMKPYILTARNGIYVIDLEKTQRCLQEALLKVSQVRSEGKSVLFVGTKPTISGAVAEEAKRSGSNFVTTRWLGGMLTNYQTVRQSIKRLEEIERMERDGLMQEVNKKEAATLNEEREHLLALFEGIRDMRSLPGLVFVADAKSEDIALREARRLRIPTIAIVDTNTNPLAVDYPIPGNDDAIKSVKLIAAAVSDTILASAPAGRQAPAAAPVAAPAAEVAAEVVA